MDEQRFMAYIRENQSLLNKLIGLYANDPEEKKDLYQEVLYQSWHGRQSYRNEAKFSTWLYRVCLNTILTHKRKQKIVTYTDDVEPLAPAIQHQALATEDSKRLYQAIRRLAESDRAIISLHLDGYDNGEIGTIVGISTGNVAVKIHRIKDQLTKLLKH